MRRTIVKCSKCKQKIFYLPSGYNLDVEVECYRCGSGKKLKKDSPKKTYAAKAYAHTKKGVRPDIHPKYSFRSATEANFARLLNWFNIKWDYELVSFSFSQYKTRPFVYVMDFRVLESSHPVFTPGLYEVKGWFDSKSRNKLTRLKACYPEDAAKTTVVFSKLSGKAGQQNKEFLDKKGYRYLVLDDYIKDRSLSEIAWE